MEQEIWKIIEDYPMYEVSNLGKVRKISSGQLLKQCLDSKGYPSVNLNDGKKATLKVVHRFVAKAFIPNPECKPCVDHIDANKTNNKLENLQLVTNRYNLSKDSWRTKKENLPVGVSRQSGRNSFVAYIDINGGHYYLGSYNDVESASNAYNTALCNYQEKGILPTNTEIVRHKVIDGYKICSCCGRNLPLSDYYISKGRVQGRCKECFRR